MLAASPPGLLLVSQPEAVCRAVHCTVQCALQGAQGAQGAGTVQRVGERHCTGWFKILVSFKFQFLIYARGKVKQVKRDMRRSGGVRSGRVRSEW